MSGFFPAPPQPHAPWQTYVGDMNSDDQTDVGALQRREPAAVESWFLAHADQIYTFAYYRVDKDPEVAADVVQDTFITAIDRIDRYDPDRGAMSVWLMYLARNCIRSANRHRSRTTSDEGLWERIDARLVASSLDLEADTLPPDALERRETAEWVQMVLAHLPESYRGALVEHYVKQRSVADMTSRREMTESAAKSLLHRARAAFRAAYCAIAEELDAGTPAPGRTT